MEELQDLVHILNNVIGFKRQDWVGFKGRLSSNEEKLLDAMVQIPDITDQKASELLFHRSSSHHNYRRYRRQLRYKLLQEILQFDPPVHRYNSFQRAYYHCQQLHAAFNTLIGMTYNQVAKSIADQLLIKSRFYYFNEIRMSICNYLSRYYCSHELDLIKAKAFHEEALYCNKLLAYESEAEWKVKSITAMFVDNKSNKPEVSELAYGYLGELEKYMSEKLESYKFYMQFYILAIRAPEVVGDYKGALKAARKGFQYFEKQTYENHAAKIIFMRNMANCYLQLGHILDAKQVIEKSLSIQIKGYINWFMAKSVIMQIEIHQQNYGAAYNHYEDIKNQRNYKNQPENHKELYLLYGAYLEFMAMIGQVPGVDAPTRFRINKFVNEVPHFDADKRGMKIPLIIAQLLYNIYDRNYDIMESRIYALKNYCSRNLVRKSPNYRSNCFIKMLLLVPVNNFNPVAIRRKARKYHERLKWVPFKVSEQPASVEVIPYEHLWEIILNHLQAPKRIRKHAMEKSKFVIS